MNDIITNIAKWLTDSHTITIDLPGWMWIGVPAVIVVVGLAIFAYKLVTSIDKFTILPW